MCAGNHICDTCMSRMYHMSDFTHMGQMCVIFTLVCSFLTKGMTWQVESDPGPCQARGNKQLFYLALLVFTVS